MLPPEIGIMFHCVAHDDHMGHAVRQIAGGCRQGAGVGTFRIVPAFVDLCDADKIGTEQFGDAFDLLRLILG